MVDPRVEVVAETLKPWLPHSRRAAAPGVVAALDAHLYRPRSRDEFMREYLSDPWWHSVVEMVRPHVEADLRKQICQEIETKRKSAVEDARDMGGGKEWDGYIDGLGVASSIVQGDT